MNQIHPDLHCDNSGIISQLRAAPLQMEALPAAEARVLDDVSTPQKVPNEINIPIDTPSAQTPTQTPHGAAALVPGLTSPELRKADAKKLAAEERSHALQAMGLRTDTFRTSNLRPLFRLLDENNDRSLTFAELKSGLEALGVKSSGAAVNQIFSDMGLKPSNTIDESTFVRFFKRWRKANLAERLSKASDRFGESVQITAVRYGVGGRGLREVIAPSRLAGKLNDWTTMTAPANNTAASSATASPAASPGLEKVWLDVVGVDETVLAVLADSISVSRAVLEECAGFARQRIAIIPAEDGLSADDGLGSSATTATGGAGAEAAAAPAAATSKQRCVMVLHAVAPCNPPFKDNHASLLPGIFTQLCGGCSCGRRKGPVARGDRSGACCSRHGACCGREGHREGPASLRRENTLRQFAVEAEQDQDPASLLAIQIAKDMSDRYAGSSGNSGGGGGSSSNYAESAAAAAADAGSGQRKRAVPPQTSPNNGAPFGREVEPGVIRLPMRTDTIGANSTVTVAAATTTTVHIGGSNSYSASTSGAAKSAGCCSGGKHGHTGTGKSKGSCGACCSRKKARDEDAADGDRDDDDDEEEDEAKFLKTKAEINATPPELSFHQVAVLVVNDRFLLTLRNRDVGDGGRSSSSSSSSISSSGRGRNRSGSLSSTAGGGSVPGQVRSVMDILFTGLRYRLQNLTTESLQLQAGSVKLLGAAMAECILNYNLAVHDTLKDWRDAVAEHIRTSPTSLVTPHLYHLTQLEDEFKRALQPLRDPLAAELWRDDPAAAAQLAATDPQAQQLTAFFADQRRAMRQAAQQLEVLTAESEGVYKDVVNLKSLFDTMTNEINNRTTLLLTVVTTMSVPITFLTGLWVSARLLAACTATPASATGLSHALTLLPASCPVPVPCVFCVVQGMNFQDMRELDPSTGPGYKTFWASLVCITVFIWILLWRTRLLATVF